MRRLTGWAAYLGAAGAALFVIALLLFIISDLSRSALLLVAGIGVVMLAFYFIVRPRDARRQAADVRLTVRGTGGLLIAAAAVGIFIALNYLAANQFNQRVDVTANRAHTLSPQTIQVLQGLTETVRATGFFTPDTLDERAAAENLLKEYARQSEKFTTQFVDPNVNPTLAQKYDNALPGTVVFENAQGTRTEKIYTFDESEFTNALLRVTQTKPPVIYFTTGHGEYAIDDFEAGGIGAIVATLKQLNYQVEPLNPVTISETLPADTSALVIAGPTRPLSAENEKVIAEYLDRGGRVLVLADPNTGVGLTDTLKTWGVNLQANLVLDPARNYLGNAPIPVFTQFPRVPVTQDLEQLGVFFPGARAISETVVSGKSITPLFTTTPQACAKNDLTKLQEQAQIQCKDGDAPGPFVIGYAVEQEGADANTNARGRLIVIGNASFALNRWMNLQDAFGNRQLFLNMVNWLAGQEQLIAIPPRESSYRPLRALTGGELNLIAGTSILLIPLTALLIGGLLWWRRR